MKLRHQNSGDQYEPGTARACATGGLADVNDQVSNTVTDASAGHVLEVMIRSSADLSISLSR